MQTIEVSFINRRREKITADAVSVTDAPGWIVVTTDGAVVEMISAQLVKRLKFLPAPSLELVAPAPLDDRTESPLPLLRLPGRQVAPTRHIYTPLISQRR